MTGLVKRTLIRTPFFLRIVSWLTRKSPRVFMYHRFCGEDGPAERVDALTFRRQLEHFRGWRTVSLGEYLGMMQRKEQIPPYLAVITVDDGYADFFVHAYPLLKGFGAKATFFPALDFVDGRWLWWDRINHALEQTRSKNSIFSFGGHSFSIDATDGRAVSKTSGELSDFCVKLPDREKWKLITELEMALGVEAPASPTFDYMAAKWEHLVAMDRNGVEIGAHTVTHPILSKIPGTSLGVEISGSKERLEKELGKKVTSFCYPNGMPDDLNEQVFSAVRDAGFTGAVVSYNGSGPFDLFTVPRMSAGRDMDDFLWKLCGMEDLVIKLKSLYGSKGC